MKPEIKVVGNYIEGTQGGIELKGWEVDGNQADEAFTPDDLKQIAIANNTFVRQEGVISDTEIRGIRWYGNDPFEI